MKKLGSLICGVFLLSSVSIVTPKKQDHFHKQLEKAYLVASRQAINYDLNLPEKKIVILIPSYNNSRWFKENLDSIFSQNYTNYRIVYIDDCSPDGTGNKVEAYIAKSGKKNLVTLVKNQERKLALANIYNAIHDHCDDDEIVAMCDGDDFLAHKNVLKYINYIYSTHDVWLTHGNYMRLSNFKKRTETKSFEESIVKNNDFRSSSKGAQHLRTFYARLFKKIQKEDLMYQGKFFTMTYDVAMFMPMLEMSGFKYYCITDILYIYNDLNPINDHKRNKELQKHLDKLIRCKSKYLPLEH